MLSAIIQAGLLGILILIPLIYTEALPKGMLTTFLVPPPPPPPPPPPAAAVQRIVKPVARLIHNGQMMAPTVIPKKVEMIKEEEMPPDVGAVGVVGGVPGGIPGGKPAECSAVLSVAGSAPPPPPKAAPARIRVGGNVAAAKLDPSGDSGLSADREDGAHFRHRRFCTRSFPRTARSRSSSTFPVRRLLMKNAMDAVRQWRYKPTMLNGDPVEVDTTISVVFTLGG